MAELNYKAINIAKAERTHGVNFFQTLEGFSGGTPSLSDIIFVLEAGGLSEEEAGTFVDDKGLIEAVQMVVRALSESGFLAKAMGVDAKKIQEAADMIQEAASPNTGDSTKA